MNEQAKGPMDNQLIPWFIYLFIYYVFLEGLQGHLIAFDTVVEERDWSESLGTENAVWQWEHLS